MKVSHLKGGRLERGGLCPDVVEEDGFEPSKAKPADLQSVPFGHLGTPPYEVAKEKGGAGGRIRTPDLLITNQLLYQLSYTSKQRSAFTTMIIIAAGGEFVNSFFKKFFMWGAGPEGSGRETAGRSFDMAQELRCSLCRGELYPGDPYFELDGRTVCEDCLGRYARGYFAHRLRRVGRSKGERT